jgi:hypothetical protein
LSFIREIWNCFLRNTEDVFANGKQHNEDWFLSIKLDMEPGERYISRVRSNHAQPIQDVFAQINDRVNEEMAAHPEYADNVALQKQIHYGNVCYGTQDSIESVHPFTSEQLDAQELILVGISI